VATAAVRIFVEEVLVATGVEEVVAEVGEDNPASIAVARHNGFVRVSPGRMVLRYHRPRP
jgi:RimJ/RimL family protein N-acetyltransferase